MKKRIIAMILCTVAVLSLLASCGLKGESVPDETDGEKNIPSSPKYDLGGYEFTFLIRPHTLSSAYEVNYLVSDGETGNKLLDSVYRRNKKISDEYNVEFLQMHVIDLVNTVRTASLGGERRFSVIMASASELGVLAREGLLADLNAIEQLDMTKSYWDSNAAKQLAVGDKLYFTNCDLNVEELGTVCYFNRKIIKDNSLTDPYELFKNGKWTIDNWAKLAKSVGCDLNNDEEYTELDFYGTLYRRENDLAFLFGSGITPFIYDDGGCAVDVSAVDKAVSVKQKISEIFGSDNSFDMDSLDDKKTHGYRDKYDYARSLFCEDHYLFYYGGTDDMGYIQYSECDFGIVPIPKYDEMQEGYVSLYPNDARLVAIPSGMDKAEEEKVGLILEKMNDYSGVFLKPAVIDELMERQVSRGDGGWEPSGVDLESKAVIETLYTSRVYDVGAVFDIYKNITDRFGSFSFDANNYPSLAKRLDTYTKKSRDDIGVIK